jgi:hypothetical protein
MYIETFPSINDPGILVLATPSAQYDPVALEIFSRALTCMPIGVPLADNFFGDWFTGVVESVTDYLTPVADLFGLTSVAAISRGASGLAKKYRKENGYVTPPSPMSRPIMPAAKKKPLPPIPPKKR